MILTVTLNPALDVTYEVDALRPGETHRVMRSHLRAGGKGINVARVLRQRGSPVLATGLAGGVTGSELRGGLDRAGVPHDFITIGTATRRTVSIVSRADGAATVLNEPGPDVSASEWSAFVDHVRQLVDSAQVVVLAGSLPPGVPDGGYAALVRLAAAAGVPTLVDATGAALRAAIGAAPAVVKVNADELRAATGGTDTAPLLSAGVGTAIVTSGPDGLLAARGTQRWRIAPSEPVRGNATGAGDACTAAVAAGLVADRPWPDVLREAVALAAAAVAAPVAGEFDDATYTRVLATCVLR